jgi:UDP-3-O-[3-hydroxymyristoyl] glucosamine N-acyltransferase
MAFTAGKIAEQLSGAVIGDPNLVISGFAPASTAKAGDLTFAENEKFFQKAEASAATAILVDGDYSSEKKVLIRVANARIAFAKVLPLFFPEATYQPGVHPSAVVGPGTEIHPTAHVGPYCVLEEHVRVGAGTVLRGHCHVGANCQIGEEVMLFPHVTLYRRTIIGNRVRIHSGTVVGSDGFGYVLDGQFHRKVPQAGNVIIHDDVEIGANVTIDRGALGPTIIGKGSKVDNLVQIAHNVSVGEHCLIVAQAGIAGSTKLGHYVTLAGQVGIAGHIKLGNRCVVMAQSGVMHDIPEGERWWGSPAQKDRRTKRQLIWMDQLPDLARRIADLEKQLEELGRSNVSGAAKPDILTYPDKLGIKSTGEA